MSETDFLSTLPNDTRKSIIHADTEFTYSYKVIKTFDDRLEGDEIEFKSYGRYVTPPFTEYEYVLFFLQKQDEDLVLMSYQFFDVYQTIDKNWATCGRRDGYLLENLNMDIKSWPNWYLKNVKEAKISAPDKILYDIEYLNDDIKSFPDLYKMKDFYPETYFVISQNIAKCKGSGIYVKELVNDHMKFLKNYWQ